MTTIATDGKSMAADGLCTGNGLKHCFSARKLRRLNDGRLVGMAGNTYGFETFLAWLEAGEGALDLGDDGFEAIVLHPDGGVRCYNEKGRSMVQEVPAASGSGSALALGAMLAGASPQEAVEIAAQRDCYTGGDVSVEFLSAPLREVA